MTRIPQRELTAYHEAGHAVAAVALCLSLPKHVTIIADGDTAGWCQGDEGFWHRPENLRRMLRQLPHHVDGEGNRSRRPIMSRKEWTAFQRAGIEIHGLAYLAGYAAEWRRRRLRSADGRRTIEILAADAEGPDAMEDVARLVAALEVFEPDPGKVHTWLLALWGRIWKLMGKCRPEVEAVAKELLRRSKIGGGDVLRLAGPAAERIDPPPRPPSPAAILAARRK